MDFTAARHNAYIDMTGFEKVASEYHMKNDCTALLDDFKKLDLYMKSLDLPHVRSEFEDRARLFIILRLLEEFLLMYDEIKKQEIESLWVNPKMKYIKQR